MIISTRALAKIVEPKKRSLQLRTITLHTKIHKTFSLSSFRRETCNLCRLARKKARSLKKRKKYQQDPSQKVREQSSGRDRVCSANFPRSILDERRLLADFRVRILGTRIPGGSPERGPGGKSPGIHSTYQRARARRTSQKRPAEKPRNCTMRIQLPWIPVNILSFKASRPRFLFQGSACHPPSSRES